MAFQPTRGQGKFRGQITRLDEKSIKDDFDNKKCKKISFAIKTSETNEVAIGLFGYKGDEVFYSLKTKKGEKNKAPVRVPWEDRHTPPEEGATLMGTALRADGEKEVQYLTTYEAVEAIEKKFKTGDSVFVQTSTNPQQYEREGKTTTRLDYEIQKIFASKDPVDFAADGFVEMSTFQQKGIYLGSEVVKNDETDEKELQIELRVITHKDGSYVDLIYPLPMRSDALTKLAKNIKKRVKPYHEIIIAGNVRNEAIVEQVIEEDEDDWGGEKVAGFGEAITRYHRVNEVTYFDTTHWKEEENQKRYKETDFDKDEFDEEDDFDGGKDIDFGDDEDF